MLYTVVHSQPDRNVTVRPFSVLHFPSFGQKSDLYQSLFIYVYVTGKMDV